MFSGSFRYFVVTMCKKIEQSVTLKHINEVAHTFISFIYTINVLDELQSESVKCLFIPLRSYDLLQMYKGVHDFNDYVVLVLDLDAGESFTCSSDLEKCGSASLPDASTPGSSPDWFKQYFIHEIIFRFT